MKAKKWLTIVTFLISVISLFAIFIIGADSNCIYYDIFMAFFGSSILGFIMSLIEYFAERQKAMEEFWNASIKVINQLKKIENLNLDAPIDLIRKTLHEEENNETYKKSMCCILNNDAKKELINWYKSNEEIPSYIKIETSFDELYEKNIEDNKKIIKDCIDIYCSISKIDISELNNSYGNLDFIFSNQSIRKESYELIYSKLTEYINLIRSETIHFDLLKKGNGNFAQCTKKVSDLNSKFFLEPQYLHSSYSPVLEEVEAALETFRKKIYWLKSVK